MNQTALNWFLDQLPEQIQIALINTSRDAVKRALEMEKEQMMDAFFVGGQQGYLSCEGKPFKTFEQYYDSTNHPRDTQSI